MSNPTFKNRFVTYFLVGSIISIVAISLFLYSVVIPDIYKNEEIGHQNTLESTINQIESLVKREISGAEALKKAFASLKTDVDIKRFMDEGLEKYEHFSGLFVFNQKGFSYGDIDINKESITKEELERPEPSVVERTDNVTGDVGVYLLIPAQIKGEKGHIVAKFTNLAVKALVDIKNKKSTTVIYGKDGDIIAKERTDITRVEKDISTIISKYQVQNVPLVKYTDSSGASKVAMVKDMHSTGWVVIQVSSEKDFYSAGRLTIAKIFGVIGIYIVFSLILIIFISNKLLRPLGKLANGVLAVQSGDLNYKINFTSKDVFSEIAEGFNRMVQKLKSNYEELQKQTEELYERNWQVEEANKELEDSYQKLQETINQLNEAEEKYYTLVKNIPEIVCVIELDGTISFVNDVVKDFLGYHKGELVGKNIETLVEPNLSKKLINIMNKRLKRENKIIVELPMIKKDGNIIVTEAKLTYHLRNGNIDGVQAIVRDITKTKRMQNEIMHRNEELLTIYNISKSLSSTIELDNVFNLIVSEVCKMLNAEMCVLRLLDSTGRNLIMRAFSGTFFSEIEDIKGYSVLPVERVSEVIHSKQVVHMEDFDPEWLIGKINNKKTETEKIEQVIFVPICAKDKVLGLIAVGTKTKINDKRLNILNSIANNAAVAIENATLYENSKKYFIKTIDALIAAVEAKDKYTEGHSQRVSKYVEIIGMQLGLPKDKVEDLKIAGILHDVGKIGISDNILLKPGRLTNEEYEEIKQHPIISNRILYSVGLSEITMKAIACHHERYDGKGYPFGLKGDELSLECQIIAVADAFDAMTSTRSYRKALSAEQAIEEIVKNRGEQFGPVVVDAIKDIYENEYDKIASVFKETGLAS